MVGILVILGIVVFRDGPWRNPALVAAPAAAPDEIVAATGAVPRTRGPADETSAIVESRSDASSGGSLAPNSITVFPDDRDPAEAEEFRRQIEAVRAHDLATFIRGYEMPAYWRLMKWIVGQSTAQLAARAPDEAVFAQLVQHPNKYRGELVTAELTVRRVLSYDVDENPAGVKRLYELWGWPTSGRGWFYVVVTPELPPGFPEEADVAQNVRVYGYFFRVQGYQPAKAKPQARPTPAPLLIGRIDWLRSTSAPLHPAEEKLSYVVLAVGGAVVLGVIGYWIIAARRRKNERLATDFALPVARAREPYDDEFAEHAAGADESRGAFDWLREE